jgi:hypothetical protein
MKTPLLLAGLMLAGLSLASLAGASDAAGADPQSAPLRPLGECMVARHVRDWGVVDKQRLVVRTLGERYYDVRLRHGCRDLLRRPLLSFSDRMQPLPLGSGRGFQRGVGEDPVTADGRICGDLGDSVIPHGGLANGTEIPCRIDSVRRIERQAFEGVFGKSPAEAREFLDASPSLVPAEVSDASR